MVQCQKEKAVSGHVREEQILVVAREDFFSLDPAWHGIKEVSFDKYIKVIQNKKQFLPRSVMEQDVSYKQIIPYLIFEFQGTYFLMQRKQTASEQRLSGKLLLGIGGHIRKADLTSNSLIDWAAREFAEEVNYTGKVSIEPLGIINDDSNSVGQVHVGFVFLLKGDSPNISIRSELQQGELVSLDECVSRCNMMEHWSQMAVNFLVERRKQRENE